MPNPNPMLHPAVVRITKSPCRASEHTQQ